ncbi:thioredoxin fold domain-containing protein [Photorhabdus hainanensis]|uniref:thioredoxin fold domain-containing protein n=1 Tax=Photorhabdus hainanensis TaxID=1004166 RepID=UPI001BD2B84E|nr:thioredoxin fold domain-containing protein [Photorhabdus hainanensis]
MQISIKDNILFLNINGAVDKEKHVSVSVSNYIFSIEKNKSYDLFLISNDRKEIIISFENEYHAIQAIERIRKKVRNYFLLKKIIKSINYVIYPVLIAGFILSINGAITNASYMLAQTHQSITLGDETLSNPPVTNTNAKEMLNSLKQAAATGKFTVRLSSGYEQTIYVYSDPLCPYCRKIEPKLEELAKHFNVEILPVSVIGRENSIQIIEQILSAPIENRVSIWKTAIEGKPLEKSPKITSEAKKFAEANNIAFSMMELQGTPTIISDKGFEISQSLINDIPKLKYILEQK